ncbi:methylated-DNA--[protein]-cysteine S-methyltransferase [Brevibacterium album]|uniref:methylated-DNA--[protein]-cysteine S-methyltransferase n=1 Tax=Brevibacterium album TaxID=417948 RepID=UPI000416FDEF|nr:methylated-DNA--[protein]-cysteine S-methyltransferase [Brevibacterium album]
MTAAAHTAARPCPPASADAVADTVACTVETPDGPFSLIAGPEAVLASGWTADVEELRVLIHRSLRPESVRVLLEAAQEASGAGSSLHRAEAMAHTAAEAVRAYYAGDLAAVRSVPVLQASGEFRTHAWEVLRDVAPGEAITYTEYAERSGRPAAVRAAASACAMNAAALFVPCHRIVRTDGGLGGFRYGLAVKRSLLAREAS